MADVFDSATGDKIESATEALVGEGKKFATVDDLAKGKQEADAHIVQLEAEAKLKAEKLTELESKGSQEDQIAELLKTVRAHQQGPEGDPTKVDDEDLSKKIKDIMQGESAAATAEQNRSKANQSVLDKVDGDVEAAKTYLAERAKQLHMSVEGLRELGERSPEAFAKLIDVDPSTVSKGVSSLPAAAANSTVPGVALEVEGHKTKAYYDALKKEIGPAKYWNDIKIQGAYTKDATALKERFNQ